jgi:hypothetical protein
MLLTIAYQQIRSPKWNEQTPIKTPNTETDSRRNRKFEYTDK